MSRRDNYSPDAPDILSLAGMIFAILSPIIWFATVVLGNLMMVLMGWLLSGKTLCVIGPTVVAIAINAASNFLPIIDMYGICAGVISIWLIVHWTNESRADPSDSEYI
jgi:hypothetical protein